MKDEKEINTKVLSKNKRKTLKTMISSNAGNKKANRKLTQEAQK